MKLSEKLKSLVADGKITAEESQAISQEVDGIKAKAIEAKDSVIKELQGELKPFKAEARSKKLDSLVGKLTDKTKLADAIALAGLEDNDDDETIKSKVQGVIDSRPYLQMQPVDDKAAKKTITEAKSNITPVEEDDTSNPALANV